MHTTGSFLYTVIERARTYLDEPDVDAKFLDTFIANNTIGAALAEVLTKEDMTSSRRIVLHWDFTADEDEHYYVLPPNVASILQVMAINDDEEDLYELTPLSFCSDQDRGWRIEGNLLWLESPCDEQVYRVYYYPSGDLQCHYADSGQLLTGSTSFVLDATPAVGSLDRRVNAYAGMMLRLLPTAPAPIEERLITASSWNSGLARWELTLRNAITIQTIGAGLKYEIAPAGSSVLYEAVALRTAMKLAITRKMSRAVLQQLQMEYINAVKVVMDRATYSQLRLPPHMDRNTADRQDQLYAFGLMPGVSVIRS